MLNTKSVKLSNIFALLGIALTLGAFGIVFYNYQYKSLPQKSELTFLESEVENNRTYPLSTKPTPHESAGFPLISDFYEKHPRSELKISYARVVDTATNALSSGPYQFKLTHIDNKGVEVLAHTSGSQSNPSDWDQNFELSHDGRYFVTNVIEPESGENYLEFYDFHNKTFYTIDNFEYTKRMNEIVQKGLATTTQLGATVYFNPTVEYLAVMPLHEIVATTSTRSIFIYKIDGTKNHLSLVFKHDFPESEFIKVKGWDPINKSELHFAQYEAIQVSEWQTSFEESTGQSKYIEASQQHAIIRTSNANDLNQAWSNAYVTDYKYTAARVISTDTEEYNEIDKAVFEDFGFDYGGRGKDYAIYPLNIDFIKFESSPIDPALFEQY